MKAEVLRALPEQDQRRIDAAVRFYQQVLSIGALNDVAYLQARSAAQTQVAATDEVDPKALFEFVDSLKVRGANLETLVQPRTTEAS